VNTRPAPATTISLLAAQLSGSSRAYDSGTIRWKGAGGSPSPRLSVGIRRSEYKITAGTAR
jgi:hypothetical protein